MESNNNRLSLLIFDRIIHIYSDSSHLLIILQKIYGPMIVEQTHIQPDLKYKITFNETLTNQIHILREGVDALSTSDIGEFIFLFEKDMTIELQKLRSDLLFIHSAALEYKGKALLLVAPSGTGKSTTSWAMLNSGFSYLSDELAPLELNSLQVLPYPHALCLKAEPPIFKLPEDSLYTSKTIHVPVKLHNSNTSLALSYIFYLEYDDSIAEPIIKPISTAEASAKLYSNSLNILAHENGENGIQAAISVARHVKNYSLISNHLDKTCEQIKILMTSS